MKEKCLDEGTIQAFLDGELTPDFSETVARHVALCDDCSFSLARAEEESAFAFSALEQEFNTLVPTQRLWTKINDSIVSERKSAWQSVFAFVSNFKSQISNQTLAAFASLLIVVGLFTVLILRNDDNSNNVAVFTPVEQTKVAQTLKPEATKAFVDENQSVLGKEANTKSSKFVDSDNDKKEFRAVKTAFAGKESNQKPVKINSPRIEDIKKPVEIEPRTTDENLPGEETYVKTIAALTETVKERKDEVLKPSARFALEKDLAVVDDAIKKMKAEVKKNPKNEGAKQVLLSSYQNKIDLLNSVTEKTELMASLR